MDPIDVFHSMFDNDPFSKWMGMELVSIEEGSCVLQMQVRPEMLNGFAVAHGAVVFALADSALAFASNTRGRQALSVHCTVEYVAPVKNGEVLVATATELHLSNTLGRYAVEIKTADNRLAGLFRGVVYRKSA